MKNKRFTRNFYDIVSLLTNLHTGYVRIYGIIYKKIKTASHVMRTTYLRLYEPTSQTHTSLECGGQGCGMQQQREVVLCRETTTPAAKSTAVAKQRAPPNEKHTNN